MHHPLHEALVYGILEDLENFCGYYMVTDYLKIAKNVSAKIMNAPNVTGNSLNWKKIAVHKVKFKLFLSSSTNLGKFRVNDINPQCCSQK